MKTIKEYLKKIIETNSTCILALSGGPDSMCLLDLLIDIKKEKNITLICAHVNHNTRKECEKEKEFIENYLKEKNVPLEYYKIDSYQKGRFTEIEGREKRYKFLKEVCKKNNSSTLFTAHHGDDLTETILMRILRGSSIEGYIGIKKESEWEKIKIIRPLITEKKETILEYLKQKNIPYILDESNNSLTYLRNKIRHKILPSLKEIEPNYNKKFLKLSEDLEKANNILKVTLEKEKRNLKENGKIKTDLFLKQRYEMQEEIIKDYLKDEYQESLNKITSRHIKIALKMIEGIRMKNKIDLPENRILYKNKDYIWIEKKSTKKENYSIKLEEKVILPNEDIVKKIENYQEKNNFEIHLNSKDIALPLYITTRKPGMKMEVKNLNGHKKISDILVNSKIPNEKKDEVPILLDNNGTILWVLGIKKSKYDLEKNENYDIIYKYIKKKGK